MPSIRAPKLIYYDNDDITTRVPTSISELNDTDIRAGDLVVPRHDYHGTEHESDSDSDSEFELEKHWSWDEHIAVVMTDDKDGLVLEYPWLDDGGEEILDAHYRYLRVNRTGIMSAKPLELGLKNGFKLQKLLAFYQNGTSAIVLPLFMQQNELEVTDQGHVLACRIYDYSWRGNKRVTAMGRNDYAGDDTTYIEHGMPTTDLSNVEGCPFLSSNSNTITSTATFTVDRVFTDAEAAMRARQQATVPKAAGGQQRAPIAWKYNTSLEYAVFRLRDYLQTGDVLYHIYNANYIEDSEDDYFYYIVDNNKELVPIDTSDVSLSYIPGWVADHIVNTLGYSSVKANVIWCVYSGTEEKPAYMVAPWCEQGNDLVVDEASGMVTACRVYDLETGEAQVIAFKDRKSLDELFCRKFIN